MSDNSLHCCPQPCLVYCVLTAINPLVGFKSHLPVLGFTVLLILAGVVLQQRSLSSLRLALRPRIDSPVRFGEEYSEHARIPGLKSDQGTYSSSPSSFLDRIPLVSSVYRLFGAGGTHSAQEDGQIIRWPKLAYAQIVLEQADLCSAVMVFADLHKQNSLPGRVLVFPEEWLRESADSEKQSGQPGVTGPGTIQHTIRLLERAAREFQVSPIPVPASVLGRETADPKSQSSPDLSTLFLLSQFNKFLLLPRPGLVQDAEVLDSLIGHAKLPEGGHAIVGVEGLRSEFGWSSRDDGGGNEPGELVQSRPDSLNSSIVLLRPWKKGSKSRKDGSHSDIPFIADRLHSLARMPGQWLVQPSRILSWTGRTLEYQRAQEQWRQNREKGDASIDGNSPPLAPPIDMLSAAYILISDRDLSSGPERVIGEAEWAGAMPEGFQDRRVWEALYRRWRRRRMDVCGEGLIEWSSTEETDQREL